MRRIMPQPGSIRPRLFPIISCAVILFVLCTPKSKLIAAQAAEAPKTSQATEPNTESDPPVFVGDFVGDGLSLSVQRAGGEYAGKLTKAGRAFDFKGNSKDGVLHGSFEAANGVLTFTAAVQGDELKINIGFESYKLTRVGRHGVPQGGTIRKETLLADSENVLRNSEIASPDNMRVAFITSDDGVRRVVVNGVEGKPYARVYGITFSPDSKRISYVAERSDGSRVVVTDGVEGEAFKYLSTRPPLFSPDGKRLAYTAWVDDKWHVIVDGNKSKPYDGIKALTFSPDSAQLAFAGKTAGSWRVVVNDVEHDPIPDLDNDFLLFSPDNKRLVYTATSEGGQRIYVNGVAGKRYDAVSGFMFSDDGRRHACIVLRDRRHVVLIDGEETGDYDSVQGLAFSPDGSRIAVGVRQDAKGYAVLDGQKQHPFDGVGRPAFSPDSRHFAYIAIHDRGQRVVLGDKVGPPHDQIHFLTFSPDSKRLAYTAVDGKSGSIVVDGKPVQKYDRVWSKGIRFSPDSKHVIVTAGLDGGVYVNVDGQPSAPIGNFIMGSEPVFEGSDRFHIVIRRDSRYFRLDVKMDDQESVRD